MCARPFSVCRADSCSNTRSRNIQHGGGIRVARIIDAIIAHDPDVVALSEFRTKPGAPLCEALALRGWRFIESTNPTGHDNGLCVLSRTPMVRARPAAPPEDLVRWLDIELPEFGFGFALLHIMCSRPKIKDGARGEAKTRFWSAVLGAAEARLQESFMFMGDFNTGSHRLDETGKTFVCATHFGKLSEIGCTDLWRQHNPGTTDWTWYSKFKGGRAWEWIPARSRLRHAEPMPARYGMPVFARRAGSGTIRSFDIDCGSGVMLARCADLRRVVTTD